MGRGDCYQDPSFTVPMPGGNNWPFEADSRSRQRRLEAVVGRITCALCGGQPIAGHPHEDARDAGRTRRRICFGRVL